jgi:putative spermidine/putrescine transport system permease protein
MALPPYVGPVGKAWHYGFLTFCGLVFLFLIAPILVIIPLSFNAEPYFTFTEGMLAFEPAAYSTRWYEDIVNNPQWLFSAGNSVIVAVFATLIASVLGTIAALGLSQAHMPYRAVIMAVLISPMIVPLIISAAGMYFFYSKIGLAQTMPGLILAHAVLGTPFVVITVTATLVGFDHSLTQASANLGAGPTRTFFKIQMPLILPGVISGGLFAFITSFDEVVVVFFLAGFEQRTIPRQMWAGIREQISPTILAVATVLVCISILLLTTVELLRRRSERLRGMSPG